MTVPSLPPDYHTHHELCRHAEGRTVAYALAARDAGIPEIAATDHAPTDCGFGQDHRMTLDQFPQYVQDVEEARTAVPEVGVLLGVEADYYRGCAAFLGTFLQQYPFDLVLGSIHFRDFWSEDPTRRGAYDYEDPIRGWAEYYTLTGELAETGLYDVVTHMDFPKRFGSPYDANTIRDDALPALDRIAKAGMAIEINTSGRHHDAREFYPSLHLLTWAAERGIGLVFGSDAHSPDRVGDGFAMAVKLAREAGFTHARRYKLRKWTEYSL